MHENDNALQLIDETKRDLLLLEVVQHQFTGKTVTSACKLAGISTDQYYRWAREGHLLTAYQSASRDLGPIAYEIIAPHYRRILENLVSIAIGQPVVRESLDGEKLTLAVPSIKDMIKASQLVLQFAPPPSMGDKSTDISASKVLNEYVPQTLHVQHTHEFIYRQEGISTQMGNLPSITDDDIIEGEATHNDEE